MTSGTVPLLLALIGSARAEEPTAPANAVAPMWDASICTADAGLVPLPPDWPDADMVSVLPGPVSGFTDDWSVRATQRHDPQEVRQRTLEHTIRVRADAAHAGALKQLDPAPRVLPMPKGRVLAYRTRPAELTDLAPHHAAWSAAAAPFFPEGLLKGREALAYQLKRSCIHGQWRVELAYKMDDARWTAFQEAARSAGLEPWDEEAGEGETWLRKGDVKSDGLGVVAAPNPQSGQWDVSLFRGPSVTMLGSKAVKEIDAALQ
jgi:hypothetical protein